MFKTIEAIAVFSCLLFAGARATAGNHFYADGTYVRAYSQGLGDIGCPAGYEFIQTEQGCKTAVLAVGIAENEYHGSKYDGHPNRGPWCWTGAPNSGHYTTGCADAAYGSSRTGGYGANFNNFAESGLICAKTGTFSAATCADFSPNAHACNNGCTTQAYEDCKGSFQKTANAAISGWNRMTRTNVSPDDCMEFCCQQSWCTSFDYNRGKNF